MVIIHKFLYFAYGVNITSLCCEILPVLLEVVLKLNRFLYEVEQIPWYVAVQLILFKYFFYFFPDYFCNIGNSILVSKYHTYFRRCISCIGKVDYDFFDVLWFVFNPLILLCMLNVRTMRVFVRFCMRCLFIFVCIALFLFLMLLMAMPF